MKLKSLAMQMVALTLLSAPLFADDGMLLTKNMSQQEVDIYTCPSHGEHAFTRLMNFRVPAQAASGELVEIEYIDADGGLVDTQTTAKPIISVYVYGPVLSVEGAEGFQGHGKRDVYASFSLDDGTTWKTRNISESADLVAFDPANSDAPDTYLPIIGEDCEDIPLDWNCEVYGTCTDLVASNALNTDNLLAGLNLAMPSAAETDNDDGDAIDTPVIEKAAWEAVSDILGNLEVEGEAEARARVSIYGLDSEDVTSLLMNTRADRDGDFVAARNIPVADAPCKVYAEVDGVTSELVPVEGTPAECLPPPSPDIPVTTTMCSTLWLGTRS